MTDKQPISVQELTPDMKGSWLVTTQGSKHIWNLDEMTYCRLHSTNLNAMDYDNTVVRITRVEKWPAVGSSSLIFYDDLLNPVFKEQWRICSTIVSIEKIEDTPKQDQSNE